jgi:hypothetical protein
VLQRLLEHFVLLMERKVSSTRHNKSDRFSQYGVS